MKYTATTSDADIRLALHSKRLRRANADRHTLVIDELGLAHAKSRVDLAVINGCIHGYEIKSAVDTLERLPSQIDIYRMTLQKITIVAAPKHVRKVMAVTPAWCGVLEAVKGSRGAVSFQSIRRAGANPDTDPVMVAHLLWHNEVSQLLADLGFAPRELRRPRRQLYELLSETLSLKEIVPYIRSFMMQRGAWRDQPVRA